MRSRLELKGRLAAHLFALAMLVFILAYADPVPPVEDHSAIINADRISGEPSLPEPSKQDKAAAIASASDATAFLQPRSDDHVAGSVDKPVDNDVPVPSDSPITDTLSVKTTKSVNAGPAKVGLETESIETVETTAATPVDRIVAEEGGAEPLPPPAPTNGGGEGPRPVKQEAQSPMNSVAAVRLSDVDTKPEQPAAPETGAVTTARVESPGDDLHTASRGADAELVAPENGDGDATANAATAANEPQPDESGAIVAPEPDGATVETPISLNSVAELLNEDIYWLNPAGTIETTLKTLPDVRTILFLVAQSAESPPAPVGIKKLAIAVGGDSLDIGMAVDFLTATSNAGNRPLLVVVEPGAENAAFLKGAYLLVNREPRSLENTLRAIDSDLPANAAQSDRIRHRLTRLDADDLRLRAGLQ